MFVKFCPASGRAEFFGHALVMCQASCWRLGRSRAGPRGSCYPAAHDVRTLDGVISKPMPKAPGCLVRQLGARGLLSPRAPGCPLEHQRWVNPRWRRGLSLQQGCKETRASTEGVLMAPALGQRSPPTPCIMPSFLSFSTSLLSRWRGRAVGELGWGSNAEITWLNPFWIARTCTTCGQLR